MQSYIKNYDDTNMNGKKINLNEGKRIFKIDDIFMN